MNCPFTGKPCLEEDGKIWCKHCPVTDIHDISISLLRIANAAEVMIGLKKEGGGKTDRIDMPQEWTHHEQCPTCKKSVRFKRNDLFVKECECGQLVTYNPVNANDYGREE